MVESLRIDDDINDSIEAAQDQVEELTGTRPTKMEIMRVAVKRYDPEGSNGGDHTGESA